LQGGSFVNHNATGKKSKTFVRGILPKSKAQADKGLKTPDLEMFQPAAPPEAIVDKSQGVGTLNDDPEFDYLLEGRQSSDHGDRRRSGLHLFGQHSHEQHPHWRKSMWEDVKVGDFVKILDDEPVPADVVICATSEDENVAFVETKNLDGETNLKSKNASPALTHLCNAKACADSTNSFRIDADRPDTSMYKFNATVVTPEGTFPVDVQETLFRGTVVRHTGWVIGLVVYTGQDTKIIMNSGRTPSKRSKVERQMNPQV
jgi:phospholipid-translocating ATPase